MMSVQNFKILCQVVPEKSLTKVSMFITLGKTDSKSEEKKKKANINVGSLFFFFFQ